MTANGFEKCLERFFKVLGKLTSRIKVEGNVQIQSVAPERGQGNSLYAVL